MNSLTKSYFYNNLIFFSENITKITLLHYFSTSFNPKHKVDGFKPKERPFLAS